MSSLPREFANRYTVRAPIGDGAFSVTYRAVDNALQRDVAVKVLREQYAAHEGFGSRFEREARAAARISHPNVISVYDYGRQGHLPYIVMQYVDGPNLKEYVREEGPLTVEESINFARQILDGLAAIHDEGIIHRDVKPQNVLIDAGLQAKITDFGVAFTTVDPGLTETGMAVGTAAYMAPEQASGEAIGPQADLYAVGVILYELLTGRLPFPGDNPVQVMYRHVNEVPEPPRALNRSVPIGVEAVVLKALAKDPYDRFPDARTMRDALVSPGSASMDTVATPVVHETSASQSGQWSTPQPVTRRRAARPPGYAPPPRASTWPVVLLVLLIIGLVIILFLLLSSGRFAGFGSSPEATPTQPVAGVVEDPTATAVDPSPTPEPEVEAPPAAPEEPEPAPTDEPTPEPPEPTPTPPEPTATPEPEEEPPPDEEPDDPPEDDEPDQQEEQDAEPPASSQFNVPFDARLLPVQWTTGTSVSLTWEQIQDAGAGDPGDAFGAPGASISGPVDVTFNALRSPSNYIGITLAGMTSSEQGDSSLRVALNGNVIWTGLAPFAEGEWTEIGWRVGSLQWLEEGENTLTIEVLENEAPVLISNATIYYG